MISPPSRRCATIDAVLNAARREGVPVDAQEWPDPRDALSSSPIRSPVAGSPWPTAIRSARRSSILCRLFRFCFPLSVNPGQPRRRFRPGRAARHPRRAPSAASNTSRDGLAECRCMDHLQRSYRVAFSRRRRRRMARVRRRRVAGRAGSDRRATAILAEWSATFGCRDDVGFPFVRPELGAAELLERTRTVRTSAVSPSTSSAAPSSGRTNGNPTSSRATENRRPRRSFQNGRCASIRSSSACNSASTDTRHATSTPSREKATR